MADDDGILEIEQKEQEGEGEGQKHGGVREEPPPGMTRSAWKKQKRKEYLMQMLQNSKSAAKEHIRELKKRSRDEMSAQPLSEEEQRKLSAFLSKKARHRHRRVTTREWKPAEDAPTVVIDLSFSH